MTVKMKLLNSLGSSVIAVLTLTLIGCGSGDFPVAPVTGVVMCNGKPVPQALVFFEPQEKGDDALVGATGLGVGNADGTFSVRTYGDNDGAVVGKHYIKVESGGTDCDCAMNPDKIVTEVEVKAEGENNFTIDLPRKTRADARAQREQAMEDDEDEEDE